MNRALLLDQLTLTEKHIRADAQQVLRQEELIDTMDRNGQDATYARSLLRRMKELQAMRITDRDRMRAALLQAALESLPQSGQ
jgi:arginine repressor